MNLLKNKTPDQIWAIYRVMDQIREEILLHHGETIRQYQEHEMLMEEYLQRLEQMSKEERMEEGVWLEEPDDPILF